MMEAKSLYLLKPQRYKKKAYNSLIIFIYRLRFTSLRMTT